MLLDFAVLVTFSSHDALKDGVLALGFSTVLVRTDTPADALLVAAQMVASTRGMPTSTTIVDIAA